MKSVAEWKTETLTSAGEHKRRVAVLRRLASGLRAEIAGARISGLSEKEQKILLRAAELLGSMSAIRDKAKSDAVSRAAARKVREKKIRAAMSANFGKLTTVADMVSLVAAVQSYNLREWGTKNLQDLKFYADEALDSLVYTLNGQAGSEEEVVAAAWEKFEAHRAELAEKYQAVIGRLGG